MAAEKDTSALPASGLAVVIALVLGYVAVQELPLEKFRPSRAEKTSAQLIHVQDAEARLWQDPFVAVLRHNDELKKRLQDEYPRTTSTQEHDERHRFAAVKAEIGDVLNKQPVTLMAVMVSS